MPRGRGGGNANTGVNQDHANGETFNKWPKDTKWAHFSSLPASMGGKGGWVRVGSATWKAIQNYNADAGKRNSMRGPGGRGHGAVVPDKKATQSWNPRSPQGKWDLAHPNRSSDNAYSKPGKTGEDVSHAGDSTTTRAGQGPKTKPGDTKPPKDTYGKFIGSTSAGQFQSLSDADKLAGLQYDAQIHDVRTEQADQHAQGAQDLADIAHWYTQIQNANSAARTSDRAQVARSAGTQDNVTQSLLDAIGGSANSSSGAVAAQGAGQSAAMRQLGMIQDQYRGNLGTALDSQQAGQMLAQKALLSQGAQGIHQTLQDLLGQRGQAVTQNQQVIRAFNNGLTQQNYQNRLAKLEAIMGAHAAAGNIQLQGIQTQAAAQQLQGGGDGAFKPWFKQSPSERVATVGLLVKDAGGNLVDESVALRRATQMGYDAALVRPFLNTYYGIK
jgi:hypothetical protein